MKLFTLRESIAVGIYIRATEPKVCGIEVMPTVVQEMGQNAEAFWLYRGDVTAVTSKQLPIIKREKDSADTRALILIETAAGIGGSIQLFSEVRQNKWCAEQGRVLWRNAPVEEGAGLVVHAFNYRKNEKGETVPDAILLEMWPGARATLRRTGQLEGAPPELTLRWEGYWRTSGDITSPDNYGLFLTTAFRGR